MLAILVSVLFVFSVPYEQVGNELRAGKNKIASVFGVGSELQANRDDRPAQGSIIGLVECDYGVPNLLEVGCCVDDLVEPLQFLLVRSTHLD